MSSKYQTEFDQDYAIGSIIETLGGSDVAQIFVHSVTSLGNIATIATALPGVEKYPERALVFARQDDVVCVIDKVDSLYLQYLSCQGIGPKNGNVIVASEVSNSNSDAILSDLLMSNDKALLNIESLVKQSENIVLNPYVASPREFKLAEILETAVGAEVRVLGGNPDLVNHANHKHNVKTKAHELGIPVPEGDIVELQLGEYGKPIDLKLIKVAINRNIGKTGRVIVKGSFGLSGSSIEIIEDNSESIQKALNRISGKSDNSFYLVEIMPNVIVSPNILMNIEPNTGSIVCVGITDQILSDTLVHEGNIYPSTADTLRDMMNTAHRMSKWLQGQGYTGLVGFDFCEYVNPNTEEKDHFLAEINPRTNAATYSKSLMEHLNRKQGKNGAPRIEAFLSTNVKTNASSFAKLNELYGHLFFKPETGKGLFPYNTGCLEHGKFTLAVFGRSRDEVIETYQDFKTLLAKE